MSFFVSVRVNSWIGYSGKQTIQEFTRNNPNKNTCYFGGWTFCKALREGATSALAQGLTNRGRALTLTMGVRRPAASNCTKAVPLPEHRN